jgi:hypothetical protein
MMIVTLKKRRAGTDVSEEVYSFMKPVWSFAITYTSR